MKPKRKARIDTPVQMSKLDQMDHLNAALDRAGALARLLPDNVDDVDVVDAFDTDVLLMICAAMHEALQPFQLIEPSQCCNGWPGHGHATH